MRYGEGLLAEVGRRTDIVQLVGRRVKLTRKGRVFWGLCPFHKEKTPSFKVENERRTYHCFGCGAGGDAFKWLQETEGLSFPEAVQRLAQEAGVELPQWTPEDEAREQKKKSLYEIIELAAQFYQDQLAGRAGERARHYLKSRGLEEATIRQFRLGYAPNTHAQLKEHLAARKIALEDMIGAGLVRAGEEGKPARDFFFDRLMFPIADARGRVVAFGGRALSEDAKPKYINTGETPLFSKGYLLYNLKPARECVAKGTPLILAEGYMDVIALARAGFEGAVAPLGTALTENQLSLAWKLAPEPILCFDGDEAGMRAGRRAAHLALPHLEPGQSLRFVFLPAGHDPDSFLRSQGVGPMRTLLENARSLADVLWMTATEGRDFSTPERRAGLEAELERMVREIGNGKIADYYRRDFNDRIFKAFKSRARAPAGGRVQDLPLRFRGPYGRGSSYGSNTPAPLPLATVSSAVKTSLHAVNASEAARQVKERELLGLLLWTPELVGRYAESLAKFRFSDQELDRLLHELLNLAASHSRLERAAVENHLMKQGFGELAGRLKAQTVVRTALAGGDENALDGRAARAIAQLRDPELPEQSDLKHQRDEALKRYLEEGSEADWEELQRLNDLLRVGARPEL